MSPDLSGGEFAIRSQAGEFRTRPGPAGGAVVGTARTEDEVAAVVVGVAGGAEEFDVVDLAAVLAGDLFGIEDAPRRTARETSLSRSIRESSIGSG